MPVDDFRTSLTCANCKTTLLRVPQAIFPIAETEPDAAIICPDCGALGVYEEVVKHGAGLMGGILTQEQRAQIIEKLRVTPRSP